MDIFNRTEGFLPELEFDRGIELSESRVKVMLKSFGIAEVNRVSLVSIFGNVGKV